LTSLLELVDYLKALKEQDLLLKINIIRYFEDDGYELEKSEVI